MKSIFRGLLTVAFSVCVCAAQAGPVTGQGTWETTLKARDATGNAVALSDASAAYFYDTTLNVTWLANMNANGAMNWSGAGAWAGGLTDFGGGWRLPAIIDSPTAGCNFSYSGGTDCGYNVETQVGSAYSEWAHLYYVTLGNLSPCNPTTSTVTTCDSQTGGGLTNTAYFQNMQSNFYWSGTEYAPNTSAAWLFSIVGGLQYLDFKSLELPAVAVRSGDVLRGGTVPEPSALVLALTALAGLGVSLRRRAA